MGSAGETSIEFSVSDPAQLNALPRWIEGNGPLRAERVSAPSGPGELGMSDIVTAVGSSGALIAAIKVLPEFIRSRRSDFHIEATVKGERFIMDVKNADEQIAKIIEKLTED